MSDEIIKLLDDLGQRFGIAIDWSSENVLPYLKDLMERFVKYETTTSILWITVCTIGLIACIITILCLVKTADSDIQSLAVLVGIIAIVAIVIIICQISDIITVNTIPEKMIYEYLNNSIS